MLEMSQATVKGIYVVCTLQLFDQHYNRVPVMEMEHGRWFWVTNTRMYFKAYAGDSASFWLESHLQPSLWETVTGRFFVGSFPGN